MLTAAGCLERRRRLWAVLPDGCEWVLIADPRHVRYFSNFGVNPVSFSADERGLLLLERGGRATLLADNFTRRSASGTPHVDDEIVGTWYDHRHSVGNRDHVLIELLGRIADRLAGRPGLIEAEALPVAAARVPGLPEAASDATGSSGAGSTGTGCTAAGPGGSLSIGSVIRQLRRRKEPDEIALLERCMAAGAAGHERALEVVRPGLTELDVYREIQSAAVAAAGQPVIVYGDFRTTNARTPKRGGLPTTEPLGAGDLLILDFSVVLHGYRSDFTNTVAVAEPTPEQRGLFELCHAALAAGEQSLRAGVRAAGVFQSVSAVLEQAGHPPLVHHAGHGIGLAHPEPPVLVPDSDDELLAGDVVTLEPGLYVAGVGGVRLEHNFLVTDTGSRRLSPHRLTLRP